MFLLYDYFTTDFAEMVYIATSFSDLSITMKVSVTANL
jgi:hypothetical protein